MIMVNTINNMNVIQMVKIYQNNHSLHKISAFTHSEKKVLPLKSLIYVWL